MPGKFSGPRNVTRGQFLRGGAALGVGAALSDVVARGADGHKTGAVAQRSARRDDHAGDPVTLTGHDLTVEELVRVARNGTKVQLAPDAVHRVQQAYRLLLVAASKGHPIYGLNHGVGADKDLTIFEGGKIKPETRRISEQFNRRLLFVQASAIGPDTADDHLARAAMLARLNTMLVGRSGARPQIVHMYREFLNRDITPVLPTRGSPGEADITILPHVGLAMMGVGEVRRNGRRIPADRALDDAGLDPIKPFAKDALAIFSSNAYSSGLAALLVQETGCVLDRADLTFAMSLEGLNGNVAPFLPDVQTGRPYEHAQRTAARILDLLRGSYLFDGSGQRALQDPLSFRDTSQVHGAARKLLSRLCADLDVQLNSSDDNPSVIVGATPDSHGERQQQIRSYYVNADPKGAVIPSANFEALPWSIDVEALNIGLSHVARSSVQRIIRLGAKKFTKLSVEQLLSEQELHHMVNSGQNIATPEGHTTAPIIAEIQTLANPNPAQGIGLAEDIEDVETFAPLSVRKGAAIVDDLYRILSVELVNASNQMDLRTRANPGAAFGRATGAAHSSFREQMPFLVTHERYGSPAIDTAYEFLKDGQPVQQGPRPLL